MSKNRQQPADTSTSDTSSSGSMQPQPPADALDPNSFDTSAKLDPQFGDDAVSNPVIINREV